MSPVFKDIAPLCSSSAIYFIRAQVHLYKSGVAPIYLIYLLFIDNGPHLQPHSSVFWLRSARTDRYMHENTEGGCTTVRNKKRGR